MCKSDIGNVWIVWIGIEDTELEYLLLPKQIAIVTVI